MSRVLLLIAIALAAGLMPVAGAEDAVPKLSPARSVRLLAVGDLPPFRQEVRNGVRFELPPPPGSIPPRSVALGVPKKDGGVEALGTTALTLGRISPPIKVAAGHGPLVIREDEAAPDPWVTVERPQGEDFLVVLWRDPAVGTWNKAKSLVIAEPTKPGTVTFLNVAPGLVALIYGEERVALVPGVPLERPLADGRPVACQFGLRASSGELERAVSRSLEQAADESTLVVLSKADGQGARRPMKVTVLRQRVAP